MPITPKFHLSQTLTHLTIQIHIPHIRVSASNLEIIIDQNEFHFYSSPYLLHLQFLPNQILIDDEGTNKESKAVYDPSNENGMVIVNVWKEREGLWDDLEFYGRLTNMVSSSSSKQSGKRRQCDGKISVISSSSFSENDTTTDINTDTIDCADIHNNSSNNHTTTTTTTDELLSCLKPHYGFLQMYHSIFTDYAREGLALEMLEIPNPDIFYHTIHPNVVDDDDDDDYDDYDTENYGNKNVNEGNVRRNMRLQMENSKFSPERYVQDLYLMQEDDDENDAGDLIFQEAVHMIPHWSNCGSSSSSNGTMASSSTNTTSMEDIIRDMEALSTQSKKRTQEIDGNIQDTTTTTQSWSGFTDDELMKLSSIHAPIPPITEITESQTQSLLLSLLDILYAYTYDHRITGGESTCESAWTISILSPTLSWLESYYDNDTILSVLRGCIRRVLIYPYIRNWDFASQVLVQDVIQILNGGRRVILRCLLQIQEILDKSEFQYLLNKLYIHPYIVWLQCLQDDSVIYNFGKQVQDFVKVRQHQQQQQEEDGGVLEKDSLGLNLVEIEKNLWVEDSEQEEEEEEESGESSSDSDESSSNNEEEEEEVDNKKQDIVDTMDSKTISSQLLFNNCTFPDISRLVVSSENQLQPDDEITKNGNSNEEEEEENRNKNSVIRSLIQELD